MRTSERSSVPGERGIGEQELGTEKVMASTEQRGNTASSGDRSVARLHAVLR
jgi:hypothetical protein